MKNVQYKLFLDDVREPSDVHMMTHKEIYNEHWLVVKTHDQFVDTIERYYDRFKIMPEFISFDHDLADVHYESMNSGCSISYSEDEEKTGYHCAKWLVDFCINNDLKIPEFDVHSMNPVGAQNILSYLTNAEKHI